MVKLDKIPVETKGRVELKQLQFLMEELGGRIALKAVGEEWQQETSRKETVIGDDGVPREYDRPLTTGLKINYVTLPNFACPWDMDKGLKLIEPMIFPDGMELTQLYGKQGGSILVDALGALKIKDSEELQKNFHWYRLRQQRTGFARLYPVEVYKE